jgi:hypothetical protein
MKEERIIFSMVLLFCLICFSSLSGQDIEKFRPEKCARLESGFMSGGAINHGHLENHPGCNFQYSYCIKTGQRFGAGAGGGIEFFHEQGFIPFYLDAVCFIGSKNTIPVITCQGGYAFGWSKQFTILPEAEFKGGFYAGIGTGIKFRIKDSFSGYLSLSYRHQMASVSYLTSSDTRQVDKLSYGMMGINMGVMLEQR